MSGPGAGPGWRYAVAQAVWPRFEGPVDHGRPGVVLARRGDRVVYLRPGRVAWSGRVAGRLYRPTAVYLGSMGDPVGRARQVLVGRVGRRQLAGVAGEIGAFLGVGPEVVGAIRLGSTVVIDP